MRSCSPTPRSSALFWTLLALSAVASSLATATEVSLSVLEADKLSADVDLSKIDESKMYKHYEDVFEAFSKSLNIDTHPDSAEGADTLPKVSDQTFSLLARDLLERPLHVQPTSFIQRPEHKLAPEEALFQDLAANKQTLYTKDMRAHIEAEKQKIDINEAADTWASRTGGAALPMEVVTLLRSEVEGTASRMPEKVVTKAIEETRGLMAGISAKVDRLIIYWCMPRDIYLRELFQSQIFEMIRLAGEFRTALGKRQAAIDQIYQIKGARDAILTDLAEKRREFWAESTRLKQQIKRATETMLVKKVLYVATDPNYKGSHFLQNGQNTLYKLCPHGVDTHAVHDIDEEDESESRETQANEDEDAPVSGMEFVLIDPHIKKQMSRMPLEGVPHLQEALGQKPETEFLEARASGRKSEAPVATASAKAKPKRSANRCLADRGGSQMKLLHDRCSKMLGKEQDQLDKLNEELAEAELEYNKDKRRLTTSLNGLKRQEGEQRAIVSEAETILLQIWKDYREVANMAWRLWWWLWWTRYWCRWQLRQYVHVELCSLMKIRDNIVQRFKKIDPLTGVKDCQVTPWRGGTCSKTCDRGTRTIYRVVETVPNEYGAFCPRLKATMTCNNFPCPVNCKVTPWSKFDACSAKCGEGTKSRTRTVMVNNKHRGKQCPELVDTQSCFQKPCDVDCKLVSYGQICAVSGGWSKWSGCSRACRGYWWWGGSGRRYSVRGIVVKRKGSGRKCASRYSPVRIRSMRCNTFKCPSGELRCNAKQDVVFAVDSSGSLRPWGSKALGQFVSHLSERYVTATWHSYRYWKRVQVKVCRWRWFKRRCSMRWRWRRFYGWRWRRYNKLGFMQFSTTPKVLTPLTYYRTKINKATSEYTWDGLGTQTHLAVRQSMSLFKTGRAKAQSVLVILTDSIPDRNYQMAKEIKAAKKTGVRVVIVYFGWRRAWTLKKYVSFPPRDNFIRMWSTWAVSYNWGRRWYANRFLRITCPSILPKPAPLLGIITNKLR